MTSLRSKKLDLDMPSESNTSEETLKSQTPSSHHDGNVNHKERNEDGETQTTLESQTPASHHGAGKRDKSDEMETQALLNDKISNLENTIAGLQITIDGLSETRTEAGDDGQKLPEDTFSFITCSQLRSAPFLLAYFIFFLQILAFSLLVFDIVDFQDEDNPIGIPADVDIAVRVTQFVAVLIAVMTQDDIRIAMEQLNEGFSEDFQGSSPSKWLFSIICRFVQGGLGLAVTFLLIVTVDTVFDLLLNFTATEFVSYLDDTAFFLASREYFGSRNKDMADKIISTSYSTPRKKQKIRNAFTPFIILGVMLGGLGFVIHRQRSGYYLCSQIFVQFGDDFNPALARFSGIYRRASHSEKLFQSDRVEYMETNIEVSQVDAAMFVYCKEIKAWTFTYGENGVRDPCTEWQAMSSESSSFDLLSTASSEWYVRDKASNRQFPLPDFRLSCYDEACGVANECECPAGLYGLRCEFRTPCATLEVDAGLDGFADTRKWSTRYDILRREEEGAKPVEIHSRPVFVGDEKQDGNFDLMFFTGLRWVLSHTGRFEDLEAESSLNLSKVANFIDNSFHAHWSAYIVSFISEPVGTDSPVDAATPIGLRWFHASSATEIHLYGAQSVNVNRMSSTVLLCIVCDDVNPCAFNGICNQNGTCNCITGSSGQLCQIAPNGNGLCNPFFNTPQFNYDGGDCCRATCISGPEYSCGKEDSDFVDVGFPFCEEIFDTWVPTQPIEGEPYSSFGYAVALSDNGNILAVSAPQIDSIRLFYRDGFKWVQAWHLQGPEGSEFGRSIALASTDINIVHNPLKLPPVFVAIGAPAFNNSIGMAQVFDCDAMGCSQVGADIQNTSSFRFGSSVDLSSDGNTVAVASTGSVAIFQLNRSWVWVLRGDIINVDVDSWFSNEADRITVTISGSGDVLAVGAVQFTQNLLQGENPIVHRPISVLRVYSWRNESWYTAYQDEITTLIPSFIGPRPALERWVTLSKDGKTVACGLTREISDNGSLGDEGVSIFKRIGVDRSCDEPVGSEACRSQWEKTFVSVAEEGHLPGWSVALSADGSVLVIGPGTSAGGNTHINTFTWNTTHWGQLDASIQGGTESSVVLSSDGSYVAVGLHIAVGKAIVYEYPSSPKCGDGFQVFRLSLMTDNRPEDTTWELFDHATGKMYASGGPYTHPLSTIVEEVCVRADDCLVFTIYDELVFPGWLETWRGNGFDHEEAGYTLFLDGNKVGSGNSFRTVPSTIDRLFIGNCKQCNGDFRLLSWYVLTREALVWKLTDDIGGQLFTGRGTDGILEGSSLYSEHTCVNADSCATLDVNSRYFDSLSYPNYPTAVYFVIEENTVISGSNDYGFKPIRLCTPTTAPEPAVAITNAPTIVPTKVSSMPIKCDSGFLPVAIEFQLDATPGRTCWDLRYEDSNRVLLLGGPDYTWWTRYFEQICVPTEGACLTFTVYADETYDDGDDNFSLFWNGTEIERQNLSSTIETLIETLWHGRNRYRDVKKFRFGDCEVL